MSITFIPFRFPGLEQVGCAFQVRSNAAGPYDGGNISFSVGDAVEDVLANRQALLGGLRPYGLEAWAELNQVHGDVLYFEPDVVDCESQPVVDGDGMATSLPGLGLFIKTADCQPILLAHTSGRHIAALHVGWRGNRCHFPISAVACFCERYKLDPVDLLAVRGPSLGPARAEFINFSSEWSEDFRPWFDTATQTMDLWDLTRYQLRTAGLPDRQIFGLDICTGTNNDLLFSYRQARQTGRQASLIWIRSHA